MEIRPLEFVTEIIVKIIPYKRKKAAKNALGYQIHC